MSADKPLSLYQLSERLRLPADWLLREAAAGRIPHLKVGRRHLFNLEAVEQALARRAAREGVAHAG